MHFDFEKLPGESNADFCRRFADSVPPEVLLQKIMDRLIKNGKGGFKGWTYAWSWIGMATNHGSGFSSALVEKYRTPDPETKT